MTEDFLFIKKDYAKILKQYNTFITVFGYEDKTPYSIFTLKQTFEKYIDLLLLSNSKRFDICFN